MKTTIRQTWEKSNLSGLHPCGNAVLLELYEPELEKSAIFIPPTARERASMIETRGHVVEMGARAHEDGRATVGDHVLIGQYSGKIAEGTLDDKKYRMVHIEDIFCICEDKEPRK